ncbi:hypothetical protein [Photobacterium leiognathi]|uniref:hypothetical protein n=1 Tax=Photobacterium leiognathi TaxID=553611 RepID=UPI0029810F93|nr:hypothetical protein [Photobacterium leiognathi]
MKKLILVTLLTMLASAGVHAKATIEQAYADDARYHAAIADATKNATRERLREDWDNYVKVDREGSGGGKVNWDDMPSGSRCGNYVMSGGVTRSQTLCQGHNPRYSCPSGFSREDFGYFEAGNGPRQYNWCSKN